MPTSLYNRKHNTRLSTGVLKRKYIIDKSDTDFPTDSESEYESDNDSFIDDSEDPFVNKSTKNLVKDKLEYYKFINTLYPSKYSASKINKLKRIKVTPIPKMQKNKRRLTEAVDADTDEDNDDEEGRLHQTTLTMHWSQHHIDNEGKPASTCAAMIVCMYSILVNHFF